MIKDMKKWYILDGEKIEIVSWKKYKKRRLNPIRKIRIGIFCYSSLIAKFLFLIINPLY